MPSNMLFNVSYRHPEIEEAIDGLVGKPYPLLRRWRLGTIGSQRFILKDANEELITTIKGSNQTKFCNIELRPGGLTIWFRIKLHTYLLALPFGKLRIEIKDDNLKLKAGPWWLHLKPAHNARLNTGFIKKLETHRRNSLSGTGV